MLYNIYCKFLLYNIIYRKTTSIIQIFLWPTVTSSDAVGDSRKVHVPRARDSRESCSIRIQCLVFFESRKKHRRGRVICSLCYNTRPVLSVIKEKFLTSHRKGSATRMIRGRGEWGIDFIGPKIDDLFRLPEDLFTRSNQLRIFDTQKNRFPTSYPLHFMLIRPRAIVRSCPRSRVDRIVSYGKGISLSSIRRIERLVALPSLEKRFAN